MLFAVETKFNHGETSQTGQILGDGTVFDDLGANKGKPTVEKHIPPELVRGLTAMMEVSVTYQHIVYSPVPVVVPKTDALACEFRGGMPELGLGSQLWLLVRPESGHWMPCDRLQVNQQVDPLTPMRPKEHRFAG